MTIRPSPELVAVVRRWNDAVRTSNATALTNMLSTSEHLRYQGTADGEFWSGSLLRQGFPDHCAEIPNFSWDEHSIEAFEQGDTGWAHVLATLRFASNNTSMLHRFTFVLTLEDGVWRMVQMHVSNPMANLEKIGVEHKALDALVMAARDGFRLDQREGTASIMFTDVANSSSIADQLGDRVWTHAIRDHMALIADIVGQNGGQLVKTLGDGTMSSFTTARAAIEAAGAIQRLNAQFDREPALALRIGIHSGDVIQAEDDFFGTVVNKAARIAAAAAPDEIRLSDATRLMAGPRAGFKYCDPQETGLKGLSGLHRLYRLEN